MMKRGEDSFYYNNKNFIKMRFSFSSFNNSVNSSCNIYSSQNDLSRGEVGFWNLYFYFLFNIYNVHIKSSLKNTYMFYINFVILSLAECNRNKVSWPQHFAKANLKSRQIATIQATFLLPIVILSIFYYTFDHHVTNF